MYERKDINICGLGLQQQPFVQYTDFIVPPKAERKPEWWILARLEQAQGFGENAEDAGIEFEVQPPLGRLDHMLRQSDLSSTQLQDMPHQTAVLPIPQAGRFYEEWIQTESGRVDCCPEIFTEALGLCEEIFVELEAETDSQLKMISRRTNYMVNSWFHNVPSLKREKQQTNPLYMHPEDARARNVGDGSEVKISNNNGEVVSSVVLDDSLKPGTVAMTHGWGHQNTGMNVARKYAGVNTNSLLPTGPGSYEKLSNQSFMTGIPVDVEVCG